MTHSASSTSSASIPSCVLAIAVWAASAAVPAWAQSTSKPGPAAIELPEITATPAEGGASAVVRKRLLTPRTGTAVPSGISGQTNTGGYNGGNANGINTGIDASRSSNGAAGTIAAPLASKPLKPPKP